MAATKSSHDQNTFICLPTIARDGETGKLGFGRDVTFAPAPPLPVAVNAPLRDWSSTGAVPWFSEMGTTHDGVAAAHSADLGDNQSSTLTTTVTGPGLLTYWWKVFSDPHVILRAVRRQVVGRHGFNGHARHVGLLSNGEPNSAIPQFGRQLRCDPPVASGPCGGVARSHLPGGI